MILLSSLLLIVAGAAVVACGVLLVPDRLMLLVSLVSDIHGVASQRWALPMDECSFVHGPSNRIPIFR